MQTKVQKWGNSLAIRIPHAMAVELGLARETPVELAVEDGRLVASPDGVPVYSLAELLKGYAPGDRDEETDWGPAVGLELEGEEWEDDLGAR